MYLSVARMDRASSLPNIKSEPDEEQKTSTVNVPVDTSRRASSSVNLNVGQPVSTNIPPSSEPVMVKAPTMGMNKPVPAVRITYTHPKSEVHIVPLSRLELGEVWNTRVELSLLEITLLERGWHTAVDTFIPLVDYSETYLRNILSTLRNMQYMNDKPLDLALWKRVCKTTNEMLYAIITCPICKTLRYLSMKILHISNTSQKPLNKTCEDLGLTCKQQWDEVIEATMATAASSESSESQSNQSKQLKTEHYAFSEDSGNQTAAFKSFKSKPIRPNKPKMLTWSQLAPQVNESNNNKQTGIPEDQKYHDPYDASQTAPEHFITGHPLKQFAAPDPTPTEIDDYASMINTPLWREIFRDFTKWSDMHKEAQYNGEEDITSVFRWTTAMRSRFLNLYISNGIIRAELATATLTHRARSWWLAHRTRTPNLIITFEQLVEWIKRELVPHSSTTDAVSAWSELSFKGDPDKYISDLKKLINHYPLRRESIIIMATKPLGSEIQRNIQLMDLQYGPNGINIAQLKQAIRNHLSINRYNRQITRDRYIERAVPFQPRQFRPNNPQYQIRRENIPSQKEARLNVVPITNSNANNNNSNKRNTEVKAIDNKPAYTRPPSSYTSNNTQRYTTLKRKVGIGPTPCFVCGSDKHSWIDCTKKKKGKCACCGSEGHLTRTCAQRYHPEVKMSFHQCLLESDKAYEYIEENIPLEDSDIEEYDDDIEECQNENCFHETSLGSIEEDELAEELKQLDIKFHAFTMCSGINVSDESDIEILSQNIKLHQAESSHELMPWQIPSPRDYEGHSLEEDLPVKLFKLGDLDESDKSDSDHEPPPLPEQEASVYSTRLPRRRFKFKFHSDIPQKPHAPIDPKWESQLTLVESDNENKYNDKELSILHDIPESEEDIPNTVPTSPENLHHTQPSSDPIPQPQGDQDPNEPNIPPHVSVWKKFGAPLQPHWNELFKILHNDSYPHLKPIQPPNKLGQLLYKFNIEGYEVTTLLDLGASHSFLTREWASDKGLDLTPIRPPRPVGLFSGHKNYIRHVAMVATLKFKDHARTWRFYIIDSAPFPAILGADAILSWPIFFSPLDHRIFIIPDLYHSKRNAGDLGGVYEYWHNRDALARGHCLAHRAFYKRDGPTTVFDQTPSTSEDESYRARHAPVPICYMNMEDENSICAPWHNFDTSMLWLHAADGLTMNMECDQENLLQLYSVTASGEQEAKELEDFRQSIAPSLLEIVDKFPKLFAPPDSDPPSRPVKHYIYVSPDTIPAARRAYRLGDNKREAMMEQMRELIDKGWVVPSASP